MPLMVRRHVERIRQHRPDKRTGKIVSDTYANWTTHPNNPMAKQAAE
jgi:hypothetical protein